MNYIIENYSTIIAIIVCLVCAGGAVYAFFNLTPLEKHKKIKEWLLYAVTIAEHDLGGGTGQIKLRQVYDMFLNAFPLVGKIITFNNFSSWVDEALDKFKEMLTNNGQLQNYVGD